MKQVFLHILFSVLILNGNAFPQSLDLTIKGNGLSFGNSRQINGVRLNFRDRGFVNVNGVNMTIWHPHEPGRTFVNGIALGIPMTGGRQLKGVSLGIFGVAVEKSAYGMTVGLVGAGAGNGMTGINIGGIGLGAGGSVKGLGIGGIGLGAGKSLQGIMIGGLALGAGEQIEGFSFAILGSGAGKNLHGVHLAGLGTGCGKNIAGLAIALLGIGAGERITGITIAGLGVGSGDEIRGIAVGGIGVGSPKIRGFVAGLAAGSHDFSGLALTPAYFLIEKEGIFRGAAVSAFNRVRGEHRGFTIGLVNYARELRGVQIGVINIASSNRPGLKVLPLFNASFH